LYVVSINNAPIFSLDDLHCALLHHSSLDHPPTTLEITVAPECTSTFGDQLPPLHLRLHDLHHIAALQSLDRVVCLSMILYLHLAVYALLLITSKINMAQLVHQLQHTGMTEEERSLKCFTH